MKGRFTGGGPWDGREQGVGRGPPPVIRTAVILDPAERVKEGKCWWHQYRHEHHDGECAVYCYEGWVQ